MSEASSPVSPSAEPGATAAATAVLPPSAPTPRRGNGFGLAALILGIVALLGAAFPFVNILSTILAVVGIILGIIGLTRKGAAKGTSIAGTIISGVAIIVAIVAGIVLSLGLAALNSALETPGPVESTSAATDTPVNDDLKQVPDGGVGSFANPVPIGVPVTFTIKDVDTWVVTVQSSTLNANDLVAAADPTNPTTKDGSQFALVNARFEHVADGVATPSDDLSIVYATAPGNYYREGDVPAVTPAPSWRDIVGIQRASIAGNAIAVIPTDAVGVWGITPVGSKLIIYFATK